MRPFNGIKPQDIIILLKLVTLGGNRWRHVDLADSLGLSQTEISFAMDRCRTAGFIDIDKKTVIKPALLEFLVHGLKYMFPAKPGPVAYGIPTAHSAPPLARVIVASNEEHYIWRSDEAKVRGQTIEPLHPNAPFAALTDSRLYELLALVDTLRTGRHREQALAVRELEARLSKAKEEPAVQAGISDELPLEWQPGNDAMPKTAPTKRRLLL